MCNRCTSIIGTNSDCIVLQVRSIYTIRSQDVGTVLDPGLAVHSHCAGEWIDTITVVTRT